MPLKSRISKKSQLADDVYLTSEAQDSPVHAQRKNQRAHSEVRRSDPNQAGASHSAPNEVRRSLLEKAISLLGFLHGSKGC